MAKNKVKKFLSDGRLNPAYLEELRRQTLIKSTASSMRLAGIKITEKEVEQIVGRSAADTIIRKNIEKLLSKKQLAVWQYLQGVDEATPGEIARKAKVARPTVNQALDKLLRLKKVERIGLGRSTRYRKL
ncbi:MAG: helix-turn-helix domain-containing protein [Patescibacteria group bacterium]